MAIFWRDSTTGRVFEADHLFIDTPPPAWGVNAADAELNIVGDTTIAPCHATSLIFRVALCDVAHVHTAAGEIPVRSIKFTGLGVSVDRGWAIVGDGGPGEGTHDGTFPARTVPRDGLLAGGIDWRCSSGSVTDLGFGRARLVLPRPGSFAWKYTTYVCAGNNRRNINDSYFGRLTSAGVPADPLIVLPVRYGDPPSVFQVGGEFDLISINHSGFLDHPCGTVVNPPWNDAPNPLANIPTGLLLTLGGLGDPWFDPFRIAPVFDVARYISTGTRYRDSGFGVDNYEWSAFAYCSFKVARCPVPVGSTLRQWRCLGSLTARIGHRCRDPLGHNRCDDSAPVTGDNHNFPAKAGPFPFNTSGQRFDRFRKVLSFPNWTVAPKCEDFTPTSPRTVSIAYGWEPYGTDQAFGDVVNYRAVALTSVAIDQPPGWSRDIDLSFLLDEVSPGGSGYGGTAYDLPYGCTYPYTGAAFNNLWVACFVTSDPANPIDYPDGDGSTIDIASARKDPFQHVYGMRPGGAGLGFFELQWT